MPTCLCNREEALEILSQNLYPKTYDKLNEEYDRLKKYNKKLKQIEFYIDIMVNSLLNNQIHCSLYFSDDCDYDLDTYEEDSYSEHVKYMKTVDYKSEFCYSCGSFDIFSDTVLFECCEKCNFDIICYKCSQDHDCNKHNNFLNINYKNSHNNRCFNCDNKNYYNKILLLNNINKLKIINKLLYRKIYDTVININCANANEYIDVHMCNRCCKFYEWSGGRRCNCNIQYNCDIKELLNDLIEYNIECAYKFDDKNYYNRILDKLLEE